MQASNRHVWVGILHLGQHIRRYQCRSPPKKQHISSLSKPTLLVDVVYSEVDPRLLSGDSWYISVPIRGQSGSNYSLAPSSKNASLPSNLRDATVEQLSDIADRMKSKYRALQNSRECNPLLLGAIYGMSEVVADLIHRGIDVHVTNAKGHTALTLAANSNNRTATVSLLLAAGASANAAAAAGKTPLLIAAGGGNAAIVALLLEAGADVNAVDQHGQTALMLGIRHPDVISMLLDACADVHITTARGWTCLAHAVNYNAVAVIDILLHAGFTAKELTAALERVERVQQAPVLARLLKAGAALEATQMTQIMKSLQAYVFRVCVPALVTILAAGGVSAGMVAQEE
jgi:ankyrin repeat protein